LIKRGIPVLTFLFLAAFEAAALAGSFTYDSKGKRDPFMPLVGYARQAVSIEDIISVEDINLEGIAVGRNGKMVAVINGMILKEGDKIGTLKVKKISAKSATVSMEGREYELSLSAERK
jgi:sulfur carrier protein ThiS